MDGRGVAIVLGVSLVLLAYTLMASMLTTVTVVIEPTGNARVENGMIVVEASTTQQIAVIKTDKHILVSVGGLQQISLVPPAQLKAVDENGNVYGPASVIALPPGTYKVYIIPTIPGTYVVEVRG